MLSKEIYLICSTHSTLFDLDQSSQSSRYWTDIYFFIIEILFDKMDPKGFLIKRVSEQNGIFEYWNFELIESLKLSQ